MTELGTLGRYTLLRRLAAGGMGEVYLAEIQGAANFTRKVAIKRILPHLAQDPDFVRKFIDEANLMVQLHHGNIVPLMELADHDGELYLVMEYLPGRDLKAVIRRLRREGRRMPHDLAMWLVAEILAGLDYAHRKHGPDGKTLHIVHRDVSPSNVCLGAGGEVKLVDFGIARARGGLHKSISGTLQGKFVYMSPEQADGLPVDPRSDVFSAGLVLYELLTGTRPFEADTETAVLRKVREAQVLAPSMLETSLPPEVDAVVMKALARSADARYPSAAEMRRALIHTLADARSHADAATLSRFLAEIFPEGVVPQGGPAGPLSLDAALQMQLGALTPSAPDRTRTRTGSGLALLNTATPAPHSAPLAMAPTATATPPQPGLVSVTPVHPHSGTFSIPGTPAPKGRRRFMVLGIVLGVAAALGAVALLKPGQATLQIETAPAVDPLTVFVDGAEVDPAVRLTAGEGRRVCVQADGYQRACRYLTLTAGPNPLKFELDERPLLRVLLDPPDAKAEILVNNHRVNAFPFDGVRAGQNVDVRVVPAEGWETELQPRQMVRIRPGDNQVRFTLLRTQRPIDAAPPAPDAGGPDAAVPSPTPTRPTRPRVARVEVRSTPAGQLTCSDGTKGPTPRLVTANRRAVRCTVRAPDRVPATTTIRPGDASRPRTLKLEAYARITVRARPGAAGIYLDQRLVRDASGRTPLNPLINHPVAPGRHTVQARLERDGTLVKSRTVSVELAPGQVLDEAIVLQVPKSGGSP